MIRLFKVFMSPHASKDLEEVLSSGYIGEGSKVKEFEEAIARFIGNPNILAVNSGTSAIKLALRVAGVEPGDIVVSTPMTCLATNMAVLDLGAKIVWSDVDPKSGLMTYDNIMEAFMGCRKPPKAILCMHWGGLPCDLDEINLFGVPVIEDACQAFGSSYGEKMIGNHSFTSCFSFQAIKTLTTGDGGAIAFRRKEDLKRARLMKWFGLDRSKSADMRCGQDPIEFGYKMQMNNITASIGLSNIFHLSFLLGKMQWIVDGYEDVTILNPSIDLIKPKNGMSSNWLCTVLVDDSKDFIAYMEDNEIECSKVHDRNDIKRVFKDSLIELKGVEEFNRRHVCIPCGWWLNDNEIETIKNALRRYKNG